MAPSNPQRLADWFDAYAARLALYARNWLDRAAAEDVVQEAFLRLLAQLRPPANVKAWLFTAVRHAAIDEQRGRRRRGQRELAANAGPGWFESRPEDLIDAATAQQALAALPDDQREIILLRIWAGLTLAEASQVLSEPVSTLFSRYKTGLAAIRQTMEMSCRKKTT